MGHLSRTRWSRVRGAAGRPGVQHDSDPGPRSCGLDQLFGPFGPGSELTRGRSAVPANSDPCPRSLGSTSYPGDSIPGSSQRGVDRGSRPTGTCVRGAVCPPAVPAVSVPCRAVAGRPALLADATRVHGAVGSTRFWPTRCLVQASRGDQLSRPTRTRLRGAVGSTIYPGPLDPGSKLTRR